MTQLIIIIAYLSLLLLLGLLASRFSRGTSSDYMLASHSIGPFLLLMSLFGTTMTAFALLGSTGASFKAGIGIYAKLASAAGIVHSACFFVVGIPLWKIGRKHAFRTQIQYFRARYDNQLIGYLLFPLLVGFVITYLLVGVVGAGAVINTLTAGAFEPWGWFESAGFGVPNAIASAMVCTVVLGYVFFGGMRGTAWANTFQTAFFMVLGIVTFVTLANALGKTDSLWDNLRIATESVANEQSVAHKVTMSKFVWSEYLSYLLIPVSVAMFPHIFQHWLTARSASTFKLPIVLHPIMVLIVWAPCVLIGVWANSPLAEIPPDTPTNGVLAMLVSKHTGPLLGGLLTAGILAAIMSSLDSQFLCLGTIFTEDIVRNFNPAVSDKHLVWYARFFVVAIVIATFVLSLVLPRSVFQLGLWSFTGFTGLAPIVIAGLYWRRVTAPGAIAAIVVTAVTWWALFARSNFGGNPKYNFPEWDTPTMLPIATVTLASTIALIGVSLMTKPPNESTLRKFF